MAIPLGTNDLKILRRHAAHCSRFPNGSKKPLTHRPQTPKERKADSCDCPIWCLGYLAKETQIVNGNLKPKRVFASLGTNSWAAAETEVGKLYEVGRLPPAASTPMKVDPGAITVGHLGERFLASRKGEEGSLDPVEKDTYDHYAVHVNQRRQGFGVAGFPLVWKFCDLHDYSGAARRAQRSRPVKVDAGRLRLLKQE